MRIVDMNYARAIDEAKVLNRRGEAI